MIAFALIIIIAISIVAVASALYWIYYRHRINKQLHSEAPHARRLLSPLTFTVITAFVVLIAYAWLAAPFTTDNSGGMRPPQEYFDAIYDFQAFGPQEMTGYRSLYSMEDNPGYTKTVSRQGDIQFTCFIREDSGDFFHPSFIIYAEYTGDKDILYRGYMGNFFTPHDINMGGKGAAGGDFNDYVCVIGTATMQSRFELNIYLYDSDLKSEDMAEYAAASGTIAILIPAVIP